MFGTKKIFPVVPQARRLTAANFASPAVLKKGKVLIAVHTGYQNIHIRDRKAVCLEPAKAVLNAVRFDHIYEHTHDLFPSYFKKFHAGTLVHSYFERNAKYFIPGVKGSDYALIGGMYNSCHFHAFSHLLQQVLLGMRADLSASITLPAFCIYDAKNIGGVRWDTYDSFIINPRSDFSEYISYFKKKIDTEPIGWKIFIQNGSKMESGGPSKSASSITMNIVNDLGMLTEVLSGSFKYPDSAPADR
jgi:hypothetical protein